MIFISQKIKRIHRHFMPASWKDSILFITRLSWCENLQTLLELMSVITSMIKESEKNRRKSKKEFQSLSSTNQKEILNWWYMVCLHVTV